MKGKRAEVIAIGVLSALALVFLASTCTASTIYVPDNYLTIQAAVNAASSGDTIIVRDGTYIENIKVDKKRLTILSENGADSTIIQAKDPNEHVFNVTADYVEISGFTVEGAYKGIGIYLYHADCNISNNSCLKNYYGILLYYSNNTQITENTFINNSYGLYLASSSNNLIYHNNIINNAQQASDDGSNEWDNGYPSGGNYWSNWIEPDDYTGVNQNITGFDFFVDYPRDRDRYPFTLPDGWDKPLFTPDVLLVKFSASATNETIYAIVAQFETEIIEHISILDVYFLRILTTNRTESEVVYLFEKNTSVDFALLDYCVYEDHHLTHPNDPLYPQQWGLNNRGQRVINQVGTIDADVDAPQAWEHKTDCSDIVVAVIDSGVYLNHPDLAGNLWTNHAPTFGDLHGAEFSWNGTAVIRDGTPDDTSGHGTHCAGIIGAVGNNGMGVTGVNGGASIMALKAAGNLSADSAAVNYTIAQKRSGNANVKVISYSRSTNRVKTEKCGIKNQSQANRMVNRTRPLYSLMVNKTDAARILFVCSAGNEHGWYWVGKTLISRHFDGNIDVSNFSAYPCKLTNQNIICVAASDNQDRPASFSNWGNESVDLFAPGVDILSLCSNISSGGPLIYNDTDGNNVVSVNYTRLTKVSGYNWGSLVAVGDSDVGFELTAFGPGVKHDRSVPWQWDIYVDADGSNNVTKNDTRMTEVLIRYSAGTVVASGDSDVGWHLVAFNNSEKYARVTYMSGTSMATPFVSGAVAHCWSLYPGKNHLEIKEMIKNNVEPRPGLKDKVKWGKNNDGRLRMCMGDDFGDANFTAQSKYPTKTRKAGASHEDIGEEWLGADVSPEFDADKYLPYDVDKKPNLNPFDTDHYDDGVVLYSPYIAGKKGKINFTVSTENPFVRDSGKGRYDEFNATKNPKKKIYVNVYFDWNADGDWDDTGEHIVTPRYNGATWWGGPGMKDCLGNLWSSPNKKTITIEFVVPTNAKCISPWVRVRLDYGENVGKLKLYESDNSLNKTKGLAQFGEVEDYPPCIEVKKTVWDPVTKKWVESRVAKKCNYLKFKCTIHPKCCNLTNIIVKDVFSESLNYTGTQEITVDNVTIDVNTTVVPGPDDTTYVTWTSPPAFKLKKCQTMTIIFDVQKKLEGCDKNTQIIKGKVCNKTFTVTSNTVDIFDINVNKTVWDPVTKKWVESRVAKKCENLKFKCVIHPKCCNLTNIAVKDVLSESLNYTGTQEITVDNETFNVTPTVELGPDNSTNVTWTFPPAFKLKKCQTLTIIFDAHKKLEKCDSNYQILKGKACNKTGVTVKSNTVDIFDINVNKTVWDPVTKKWVESRVAKKCDDLTFNCTIHPKCCNLTNINVTDILSKSLNYTDTKIITKDGAIVNYVVTVEPGPDDTKVTWTFPPDFKLKKCQTLTIIFDAHKKLEECDNNTQIVEGKACNKTWVTVKSNTVDIFDVNVKKEVWNPATGRWDTSRVAKVCDPLLFRCKIHPKCCNLTNIVVIDILSESLNYTYTENITIDDVPIHITPTVEVEPGPDNTTNVTWTFPPDFKLEKCQNMVIHFFAHKVKCYDDWNTQIVIAKACNKTYVAVLGNTVGIIEAPGLTAKQLRNVVAEDDDYTIEGRATCVDYVDIVLIGPEGYYPIYDPLLDVLNGLAITSTPVTDKEFSENIIMGEGVDTGRWIAMVFSPGRDGEYGDLSVGAGNLAAGFDIEVFVVVETQDQIVEILKDHTVNVAGSDDLLESFTFKVESPFVKLNPIEPVAVGEPLVVTGTSNRQEGYMIVVTCKGPVELAPHSVKVENDSFGCVFDTTDAKVGTYTVKADDGDGHTDELDVVIYGAAVPPSEP